MKIIKNRSTSMVIIIVFIATLILGITYNNASAITSTTPSFDVEMSVNKNQAEVGEDIIVSGKIIPKDFELKDKEKEIILILDASGSMKNTVDVKCSNTKYCREHGKYGSHNSTKISELKKAATTFLEKMKDIPMLKIAVVSFSNDAIIETKRGNKYFYDIKENDEVNKNLMEVINNLKPTNGTNTGEGLRKSVFLLSSKGDESADKTVILMSDGIPTAYQNEYSGYGYNSKDYYYMNTDDEVGGYFNNSWDNYYDTVDLLDLGYAMAIGEKIKSNKYKAYNIGYGLDRIGEERITALHNSMSNESDNLSLTSDGAIEKVFSDIADKIKDSYCVTGIQFNTKLSEEDFHISLLEDTHCSLDGKKIIIPDIVYKKQDNTNIYKADPVEFSFVIQGQKANEYSLFKDSKFTYLDGNEEKSMSVKSLQITILNKKGCNTIIEVSDSAGAITDKDKYSSSTASLNKDNGRYELAVNNSNTGTEYKLYGSAKAEIKGEYPNVKVGESRFLQYQFIDQEKDNKDTTDISSIRPIDTEWKDINLDFESFNPDVGEQEKLTVRAYSVDHMPLMADEKKWENRENVFKNPNESIDIKSASISNNIGEYVSVINNGDGYKLTANTIFTDDIKFDDYNQGQELSKKYPKINSSEVINLSKNYKEAYKYWGYFSPKKTGFYLLGLVSDDGSSGTITVGNQTIEFSKSFKIQSNMFTAKNKVIYLEAGKYYPINLEYFNWGGGAVFKMVYKYYEKKPSENIVNNDSKTKADWQESKNEGFNVVSAEEFFASKSNEPGESSTGIFTGVNGVSFPNEVGRYYIAYRCGIKDDKGNIKDIEETGMYGPFNLCENITLSRQIVDNKIVENYNEQLEFIPHRVTLEYTITPNQIEAQEIYKGKNTTYAKKLYISKYSISDNLPKGINVLYENGYVLKDNNSSITGKLSKNLTDGSTKLIIDLNNYDSYSLESQIYLDLINSKDQWYDDNIKNLYPGMRLEDIANKVSKDTCKDIDIVYTLNDSNKIYTAKPITFTIDILCNAEKSYELLKENTINNYSDVIIMPFDRKLNIQNNIKENGIIDAINFSKTIKHGIYINNEEGLLSLNKLNVSSGASFQAGVIIEAVGKCELNIEELPQSGIKGNINLNNAVVYKLNEKEKMVEEITNIEIDNFKKSISLNDEKIKGKYLIIYTYEPKENATGELELKASMSRNDEGQVLKVKFNSEALPDLF